MALEYTIHTCETDASQLLWRPVISQDWVMLKGRGVLKLNGEQRSVAQHAGMECPAQPWNSTFDFLGQAIPPGAYQLSSWEAGLAPSHGGFAPQIHSSPFSALPCALEADRGDWMDGPLVSCHVLCSLPSGENPREIWGVGGGGWGKRGSEAKVLILPTPPGGVTRSGPPLGSPLRRALRLRFP